jgi:phosphoesterase RecJ-like protein
MDAGPGRGWQALHEVIEQFDHFLLTSHIFPEGDSLGSEVALALHLRDRGKSVYVLNPTPPRQCYRFLLESFPIHHLGENGRSAYPDQTEVLIALDVGQWEYMGALGAILREADHCRVAIDHHHPSPDFAEIELIDPEASSTGEMVYQFLRWSAARISPEIANALYASVMFDTGGLRLPQTKNRTVLIAADLLRQGAHHATVMRSIFQSETFERVDLYRRALELLQQEQDGRIAWISIPDKIFAETGTTVQDADGILDNLLSIQEIDVCVLFREVAGSGIRVTFRSKGRHDVGTLASRLGGGGRPTAAGLYLSGHMREAEELILPMIRELYEAEGAATAPKQARLRD